MSDEQTNQLDPDTAALYERAAKCIKRVKWRDDVPASERQMSYAKDLFARVKWNRPARATLGNDGFDVFAWEFWEEAAIPADLTKTEASKLIDMLQYLYWNRPDLYRSIAEAMLKLVEKAGVNAEREKYLMFLALTDCTPLLAMIKKERIEIALQARAKRTQKAEGA